MNKPAERFQFQVVQGVIRKVTVEQWYQRERIAVVYVLKGRQYEIAKIYRTNIGLYHKEASPLVETDICTLETSEVEKIADVIASTSYSQQFLDESCSKLNPLNKVSLVKLKEYLDPAANEGKKFLGCLADLSDEVETTEMKDRLIDLRSSYIATLKKQMSGTPAIKISCVESEAAAGTCDPQSGAVSVKIKDGKLAQDSDEIRKTFIHEIVHHSQSLASPLSSEEALAKKVSDRCGPGGKPPAKQESGKPEASEDVNMAGGASSIRGQRDSDNELTLPETGKITEKKALEQEPVSGIQAAAAGIAPQSVPQESIEAVQQVAQNTKPANANSVNAAFENVMEKPTQTFSNATTKVAQVLVPEAQAAPASTGSRPVIHLSGGGGGSSASGSAASTSNETSANSRAPASVAASSNRPTRSSTPTTAYDPKMEQAQAYGAQGGSVLAGANFRSFAVGSQEKIVEEIILPTSGGKGFTSTVIEHPQAHASQTIAAVNAKAAATPANASVNETPEISASPAGSGGLSGATNTAPAPLSGGSGGGAPSRRTASVPPSGGASAGNPAVEVAGIAFAQTNIDGAGYQRYRSQIQNPEFRASLENAGILITRSGTLLSKPREVSATYIDNGNALIYGGL